MLLNTKNLCYSTLNTDCVYVVQVKIKEAQVTDEELELERAAAQAVVLRFVREVAVQQEVMRLLCLTVFANPGEDRGSN